MIRLGKQKYCCIKFEMIFLKNCENFKFEELEIWRWPWNNIFSFGRSKLNCAFVLFPIWSCVYHCRVTFLTVPGNLILGTLSCLAGWAIFAYYTEKGCDPLKAGYISNANQVKLLFHSEMLFVAKSTVFQRKHKPQNITLLTDVFIRI